MDTVKDIEKSIIKKYRKEIWSKFIKAIQDFELVEDNDHIAVCISGGKDSMVLAKCFQELKRHGKMDFKVTFLAMDPGYNSENRKKLEDNLKKLNIDCKIFETNIFEVTLDSEQRENGNPCYLCARMRRGNLYAEAKRLGCNKIALGHHMNDVVETVLMNMIFNGHFSSMMPKLPSDNFDGMELIRPLYYIKEKYIIAWSKHNNLDFLDCACSVTKKGIGKRAEVKELVNKIIDVYSEAEVNILNSTKNVNLETVIGTYTKNSKHNFLDNYSSKRS